MKNKLKAIIGVILSTVLIMNSASVVFATDASLQKQDTEGSTITATEPGTGTETPDPNPNPGTGETPEPEPEPEPEPGPKPVPLEKPEFTKHIVTKGYYIQLEWTLVDHAAKYVVQRKNPGSATWKTIATYGPDKNRRTGTAKMAEGKYTYRIKAISEDPKLYIDSMSDGATVCYLGTTPVSTATVKGRARVDWKPIANATGYYIYRKQNLSDDWTYMKTVYGINSTSFYDNGAKSGEYYYCVKAISGSTVGVDRSIGALGDSASVNVLGTPETVNSVVRDGGERVIRWSSSAGASGYEVQYSLNRLFNKAKTISVNSVDSTYTVTGIPKAKSFFARVRAYRTVNGKKEYSAWQHCQNSGNTGYVTYERVEYGAGGFDIKARAGQSLYAYDTVQGGCSDGTYAYYALNNRTVDNCKIVKMRLSDNKIMKVSGVLAVDHGNGMAFNSDSNELVVNNCTRNPKRLTVVNPETLTVKRVVDVVIPKAMTGASNNEGTGITGFSSITYNQSRGVYVALTKGRSGFLMMDGNFNVIEYMPLTYKTTGKLWQCLDSTDKYLLIAHSPNGNAGNIIAVYDWEGRYVSNISLPTGYELENVYNVENQFYATYYVNGYSSGKHYRKNYIYKFNLSDERTWVKANVGKPTKPYMPDKPTAVKPKKSAKTASVKLKWNKASFGTGYEIYRSETKTGGYELIEKTTTRDVITFTDKDLERNKTYYYKIRTYKKSYEKMYYSKYTTVKSVKTK